MQIFRTFYNDFYLDLFVILGWYGRHGRPGWYAAPPDGLHPTSNVPSAASIATPLSTTPTCTWMTGRSSCGSFYCTVMCSLVRRSRLMPMKASQSTPPHWSSSRSRWTRMRKSTMRFTPLSPSMYLMAGWGWTPAPLRAPCSMSSRSGALCSSSTLLTMSHTGEEIHEYNTTLAKHFCSSVIRLFHPVTSVF